MHVSQLAKEQCIRAQGSITIRPASTNMSSSVCIISEEMIEILSKNFTIEAANTTECLEEAYRLRHQTYCVERGYEASSTGLEVDEFDDRSRHTILRHRLDNRAVGTLRLVLPRLEAPH